MAEPWGHYVKINQLQKVYDSTFRVVKFSKAESRMVVATGWGTEGMGAIV